MARLSSTWLLACAVSACGGEPAPDPPPPDATPAPATPAPAITVPRGAPTRDPLRVACDLGDAGQCTRLAEQRALKLPLLTTVPCAGRDPAHTLAMSAAAIDLDGARQADVAAAGAALAAANHGDAPLEIALMFDSNLQLAELRPLFAALATLTPRPRLFVTVETYVDARSTLPPSYTQHLPIAGVELGADATPPPAAGYRLRLDRTALELRDLVEPDREVPADHPLAGASLQVAASDATPWWAIAAGLARACEGARLVEPEPDRESIGRPTRRPLVTRTDGKERPIDPDAPGLWDIDAVRRNARAEIRATEKCHALAGPDARGHVRVRLLVSAAGAVLTADVVETTLDASTTRCLADATRRWKLPAPEGGRARGTYTFYLNQD